MLDVCGKRTEFCVKRAGHRHPGEAGQCSSAADLQSVLVIRRDDEAKAGIADLNTGRLLVEGNIDSGTGNASFIGTFFEVHGSGETRKSFSRNTARETERSDGIVKVTAEKSTKGVPLRIGWRKLQSTRKSLDFEA